MKSQEEYRKYVKDIDDKVKALSASSSGARKNAEKIEKLLEAKVFYQSQLSG